MINDFHLKLDWKMAKSIEVDLHKKSKSKLLNKQNYLTFLNIFRHFHYKGVLKNFKAYFLNLFLVLRVSCFNEIPATKNQFQIAGTFY